MHCLRFGFAAIVYALWNLLPLPKSALWEIIAMGYQAFTKKKYPHAAFKISSNIGWAIVIIAMVLNFLNDMAGLF